MNHVAAVAVIGAGWAGLSAALSLQRQGHQVTLYERAPNPHKAGGRASTAYAAGEKAPFAIDNGQHVLLGAYTETLRLFESLDINIDQSFLRIPAAWHVPQGLSIQIPQWGDSKYPRGLWSSSWLKQLPLATALFKTTPVGQWPALAAAALRLQLCKPRTAETVLQWLERARFPANFDEQLWQPLCYATLNTPPDRASATVFHRVIQDGLLAGSYAAAMLVPRGDLGALLPAKALQTLQAMGATLRLGAGVSRIETTAQGVTIHSDDKSLNYDALVCATSAKDAARILPPTCVCPALRGLATQLPETITTIHLNIGDGAHLPYAVNILPEPSDGTNPIQHAVAMDRGYLSPEQKGWITVVLSCSTPALAHSHDALIALALQRLQHCFTKLSFPAQCKGLVIHAKQATFACEAGLMHPTAQTANGRIVLAGDYVAGIYPATLEGAVRSGLVAATILETPL